MNVSFSLLVFALLLYACALVAILLICFGYSWWLLPLAVVAFVAAHCSEIKAVR